MANTRNILVTGGAGYVGSACVKTLLDEGHQVSVFDIADTSVDERATYIQGDILDVDEFDRVFAEGNFDAVVHLAARVSVPEGEVHQEEYFTTNTLGTLNVASAMKKHNVGTLVFASTAAVYVPTGSGFYDEHAQAAGANVYGTSKRCAERVIEEFVRTGALEKAITLRLFNVAGDAGCHFVSDSHTSLFPRIARAIHSNETFSVFSGHSHTPDGSGVRDYVHILDVCDAFKHALTSRHGGTYNIGTGEGKSVREVVAAFEQQSGTSLKIEDAPVRNGDVPIAVANSAHAKDVLHWKPNHSLKDMVRSTLKAYE